MEENMFKFYPLGDIKVDGRLVDKTEKNQKSENIEKIEKAIKL